MAAGGGLLTDVKCLTLSKVLTWLGNSGSSKQDGCRGFLSRAVGCVLCTPEAAQTPVAGHPCPAPGLALPGTTAVSSQTLLWKEQPSLRGPAWLGVTSRGCVVPCSLCPNPGVSRCPTPV